MSRIDSLFGQALAIPSIEERSAFLDQIGEQDVSLRRELDDLLAAHAQAGSFLENSPLSGSEACGTLVGNYKLLEQIGEGGMGVVFMAEQLRPVRRRVALKIIKPGMDTRRIIARFEAERQALAMMDHPNIAKVFDAGTTEAGRPYFVMELVRGVPITDYCDQQSLNPRQRLELFVQVCQAVQHAHQKGIIHRDLKPTNVLVTLNDGKPTPKVIDFGIAKAAGDQRLTERTLFTEFRQLIGTPLYMSPEQAEMSAVQDVDTRSDVYSLGVLLYELLTGTTPFDRKRLADAAYDEVRRIIREEEPPRPSTRLSTLGQTFSAVSSQRQTEAKRLSQTIRNELDWIVMKAIEKDRERRYETASGFARDVERYLTDEPVEACPPSRLYRAQKIIRRHKGVLGSAAAIAVVLFAATAVSTWQAVRATKAKLAAQTSDRRAGLIHKAMTAQVMAQLYAEGRGVPKDPVESAEWHRNAVDAYVKAAESGDGVAQANLGQMLLLGERGLNEAKVVELLHRDAEKGGPRGQMYLGLIYMQGTAVARDPKEGLKWLTRAANHGDPQSQSILASYLVNEEPGVPRDVNEALKWYRRAADQGDLDGEYHVGWMYDHGEGGVAVDYAEALKWYRKAAAQGNEMAENNIGVCYLRGHGVPRDETEGAGWYRRSAEHGCPEAQKNLAGMYRKGQGVAKDTSEALKWYRRAAEQGYASGEANLGVMYLQGTGVPKDYAEALKWLRKAADQGDAYGEANLGTIYLEGLGVARDDVAALKWIRKAADQANALAEHNLGVVYEQGKGVPRDYHESVKWFRLAVDHGDVTAQDDLGRMYEQGKGVAPDINQALEWYRKAVQQGDPDAELDLGVMYFDGKSVPRNYAEAIRLWRRSADQGNAQAEANLGSAYSDGLGVPKDTAEAMKWYRKAADQGNWMAENNIGCAYRRGEGAPHDDREAAKWFRRAADHDCPDAQRALAIMYFQGEGVAQDAAEAVRWYRKAADAGDKLAQMDLAQILLKGFGVPPDRTEALKYYRLLIEALRSSAQRGDAGSCNELAWMLATCEAAEVRDGNEALKWALKAVAAKKDPAFVDTLAAAYAEAGQFDRAVSAEKEAITLTTDPHDQEQLASHLKVFESRLPYHEIVADWRSAGTAR